MKIKTKAIHVVNAFELDSFVELTYGIKYESIVQMESGNDTVHEFGEITAETELTEYEAHALQEWVDGKTPYMDVRTLLVDMCRKRLIPQGEYMVSVCW